MVSAIQSRPILFSDLMVRAILDNRKTQTRRVMKPQPLNYDGMLLWSPPGSPGNERCQAAWGATSKSRPPICPYGKVGDRLWVRESWYSGAERVWYRADVEDLSQCGISGWKPSIFMPRSVSRLTLEITGIRVCQLQDVSEKEAVAEGVERQGGGWKCYGRCDVHDRGYHLRTSATASFMSLWNSISGDRPGCSWDDNPWVWAISFRRIEGVGDG